MLRLGLFCQAVGCQDIAWHHIPDTGDWCNKCWREMQALLARKVAEAGSLTMVEWRLYKLGLAEQQDKAAPDA